MCCNPCEMGKPRPPAAHTEGQAIRRKGEEPEGLVMWRLLLVFVSLTLLDKLVHVKVH